jgi:hypothetical protein
MHANTPPMSSGPRIWLAIALAGALPAAAQSGWDALPAAERALLAPWQSRWNGLESEQRERLLRNTRHWLGLDAAQRAELQTRLAAWNALPPAERARIRERAAAWQGMDEAERAVLRASFTQLRAMAPIEREQMREAFAQVGASERRTLLVAEDELALVQVAQQAFAFVPPEERGATLDMLRALHAADRTRLAELARRLEPEQRAELRRELLARAPQTRGAYLRQRLQQG